MLSKKPIGKISDDEDTHNNLIVFAKYFFIYSRAHFGEFNLLQNLHMHLFIGVKRHSWSINSYVHLFY